MAVYDSLYLCIPDSSHNAMFGEFFLFRFVVGVKSDPASFLYKNTSTHNVPPTVNMT